MDIWEKRVPAEQRASQCKGPVVGESLVQGSQSEWCRERWQELRMGVDRVLGDEIREVRTNIKVSSSFL